MKIMKTAIFVGLMLLGIVIAVTPAMAQMKFLTISSGPVGGSWYIFGGTLSDLIKNEFPAVKVTVTTGGSLSNPGKVSDGKADVGFTMDRLFYEARNGIGAFKGKKPHKNLMALAFLADIYMSVFLIKEDSPINSIQEIKEKKLPIRILTSPRASSPSVAAEKMLGAYGISIDDIRSWGGKVNFVSYAEASALIKDGHADAWCGPVTSPAIIELTIARKMKLLPIKESVLNALKDKYKYGKAVIPKGTWYFVKKDTPIMTESIIIFVRKDLPENMAYTITKSIATHPDRIRGVSRTYTHFTPQKMYQVSGGPLHPGALRYYRERGDIK